MSENETQVGKVTDLDGKEVQGGVEGHYGYFSPTVLVGDTIQILQKCPSSGGDHT
jgi:hypothetical protein